MGIRVSRNEGSATKYEVQVRVWYAEKEGIGLGIRVWV